MSVFSGQQPDGKYFVKVLVGNEVIKFWDLTFKRQQKILRLWRKQ